MSGIFIENYVPWGAGGGNKNYRICLAINAAIIFLSYELKRCESNKACQMALVGEGTFWKRHDSEGKKNPPSKNFTPNRILD